MDLLDRTESLLKQFARMTKKYPFTAVLWDDAWFESSGVTVEEHKHAPSPLLCVGYLLKSDDDGVSLFMELADDGSFRHRSFIPRSLILAEWTIPTKWPRKGLPPPPPVRP